MKSPNDNFLLVYVKNGLLAVVATFFAVSFTSSFRCYVLLGCLLVLVGDWSCEALLLLFCLESFACKQMDLVFRSIIELMRRISCS